MREASAAETAAKESSRAFSDQMIYQSLYLPLLLFAFRLFTLHCLDVVERYAGSEKDEIDSTRLDCRGRVKKEAHPSACYSYH